MIRLVLYGIIFYFAYRLYKSWGASLSGGSGEEPEGADPTEAELIQDPECGTYFLRQQGVSARIGGRTVYFCSEACRDAHLKKR